MGLMSCRMLWPRPRLYFWYVLWRLPYMKTIVMSFPTTFSGRYLGQMGRRRTISRSQWWALTAFTFHTCFWDIQKGSTKDAIEPWRTQCLSILQDRLPCHYELIDQMVDENGFLAFGNYLIWTKLIYHMLLVAAPLHLGDWTEEANEAWEWAISAVSGGPCSAYSPGSLIAST